MLNRRGQVALFVILGIIVIAGVVAFFFLRGRLDLDPSGELNVKDEVEKCIKSAVEPSIEIVLRNGGLIEPVLFKNYSGERYNYLCYSEDYYMPCINKYPLLGEIIEGELRKDSIEEVGRCFSNFISDYEAKGYEVSEGELNYSVELVPGAIRLLVEKEISFSNGGSSESFGNFDSEILSAIYDLAWITRDVINQESQFCNFEYNGFMLLYPDYKVKLISYDDTRLYKIKDRHTSEEFRFAIRSCAMPGGT